MFVTQQPEDLIAVFDRGGVIAYPTEAVYGLGCDPENEAAVLHLLSIKNRLPEKGLILIAADFSQVEKYLQPLTEQQKICSQPGSITYLYPALASTPQWLTGDHDSLAVRVTKHPAAKKLCQIFNSAIVSTSANISGLPPARTVNEVEQQLGSLIDAILDDKTGDLDKPTEIRDSISGKKIR